MPIRMKKRHFILTAFLCSTYLFLSAQTVPKTDKDTTTAALHHFDDVVIIGTLEKKEVIPVQTLSGEALKKLNVYSVADAVRYFSGVQVKDYGGIGGLKTVNVRSMGSHHVGVFYDGVELGNAQNGVVDLGRFSLENMEAISMYNGQKSSIFQSTKDYASASAIYMTTRRPTFGLETLSLPDVEKIGMLDINDTNINTLYAPKVTQIETVDWDSCYNLTNVDMSSLKEVTKKLKIWGASSSYYASKCNVTNLDFLLPVERIEEVDIRLCGKLTDFSGLQNAIPSLTAETWHVSSCGYNPTYDDMVNGKYTK